VIGGIFPADAIRESRVPEILISIPTRNDVEPVRRTNSRRTLSRTAARWWWDDVLPFDWEAMMGRQQVMTPWGSWNFGSRLNARQESNVTRMSVRNTFTKNYIFKNPLLKNRNKMIIPVTTGGVESRDEMGVKWGVGIVRITPALVPTHTRSWQTSMDVTRRQAALCCRIMSSQPVI